MYISAIHSIWLLALSATVAVASAMEPLRCIMYLTGQHNVVPAKDAVADITHVILAFMRSEIFNVDETPSEFPLFTNVGEVRSKFAPGTKVMVAIGGWGDNQGFEEAAKSDTSRERWAKEVAAMVEAVGADGVDLDWEYPGGNWDDYKQIPNSEREWEIEAFVSLVEKLRAALSPGRLLSIAAPGKEVDLISFTSSTVPRIVKQVDFLNIMTYDLMNRRDTTTKHHSGVTDSQDAIQRYIDRGVPPHQVNLGLGYYVKWFLTQQCNVDGPRGCPTQPLEDPDTGADMGKTGAFSWHDETPEELAASFARAQADGNYDDDGSYSYWDDREWRWWSFDTVESIRHKMEDVVPRLNVGGVFAWGLGEDAPRFEHLGATLEGVRKHRDTSAAHKDEL
ncbi:glycoside hydrolase superfamily [Dactylonectria estremocensis]|uniref:chitinase n=1 Tax=Dactylonectria estremocensis TaxID=1079267 RepID=A0A9P9EN35_9HYPO|nr:glycoside hydrolase superfamily [Dactylonectria estremocensis]